MTGRGMRPVEIERETAMKFLKPFAAWLAASLVTAAAGSIVQTQFNLAAIAALGAPIPITVRLHTTLQDLAGFAPAFAAVAGAAFLVAFPVAARLARRLHRPALLYTLAGIAAIITAILSMNALLGLAGIGATRSLPGAAALAACGALGGWTFQRLLPARAGMA